MISENYHWKDIMGRAYDWTLEKRQLLEKSLKQGYLYNEISVNLWCHPHTIKNELEINGFSRDTYDAKAAHENYFLRRNQVKSKMSKKRTEYHEKFKNLYSKVELLEQQIEIILDFIKPKGS
jgi:IS30 family transposase